MVKGKTMRAPKKARRTDASTSSQVSRFVNDRAKERFDTIFSKKKPVRERGFKQNWPDHEMGEQLEQIWRGRGWTQFVQAPPAGCVLVVKEFYSNLYVGQFVSAVRGIEVRFDYEALNQLYGLPAVEENAYRTNLLEVDHLVVSEFLCPNGTQWKYENGFPRSFPKKNMSGMAKVWLYFVGARLLPTSHVDDVTKDRAYMVYTILTGGRFDVGHHIATEMDRLVSGYEGAARRGLWYPSLITELCQRAGVQMSDDEGMCPPRGVIDRSLIMRISAANFPEVERENVQPQLRPEFVRPPIFPPAPASSHQQMTLEELARRQSEAVAYMHGSFTSLDSNLRELAHQLDMDMGLYRSMPPRPAWSYRHVDDDDEEDADDDDDDAD